MEEKDLYLPDVSSKSSKSDASLLSSDYNTKWPSVVFGSVYVYPWTQYTGIRSEIYLIDTSGPFTRKNMKSYKSLDAYEYFFDNWMHTCSCGRTEERTI